MDLNLKDTENWSQYLQSYIAPQTTQYYLTSILSYFVE